MPRQTQDPAKVFDDLRRRWAAVYSVERPLRAAWAQVTGPERAVSLEEFCVKKLGARWPKPREVTGGDNVWEVAREEAASLDFAERAIREYRQYLDTLR